MTAMAMELPHSAARSRFYVVMAGLFVLGAFGGFVPTFWAPLASGSFKAAPIIYIHGALFFAWTLFFFMQTALIANGRVLSHRDWGLAGIALATAMTISVVLTAIHTIKVAQGIGMADEARRFTVVSLSGALLFAGFVGTAIANVRRPEAHKRLMLLSMIPLVHAAIARLFKTAFAPPDAIGPPPVFIALPPGLFVDLAIVAGIVYDWRTRGRPHPVYLWGGAVLLAVQIGTVPVGASDAWLAIARWVERLAG